MLLDIHWFGPLGRFSHRVAMSWCVSLGLWCCETSSSGGCWDFWPKSVSLILACNDIIFFYFFFYDFSHFSTLSGFWASLQWTIVELRGEGMWLCLLELVIGNTKHVRPHPKIYIYIYIYIYIWTPPIVAGQTHRIYLFSILLIISTLQINKT